LVVALEAHWSAALVGSPELAAASARPGDLVIGRLDVRPTLDGIQPGLGRLLQIRERGIEVVNGADVLVATHDKLTTARLLEAAATPAAAGPSAAEEEGSPHCAPPSVVNPRLGSWGRDVSRCESRAELRACPRPLPHRGWFGRQGAIVQELIPPLGFDLRL